MVERHEPPAGGRSRTSISHAAAIRRTCVCLASPSASHGRPDPARRALTSTNTIERSSATIRSISPKRVRYRRASTR